MTETNPNEEEALRLLREIQESLDSFENRPSTRFEATVHYNGEPDCTCGVCGDEVGFSESNIVDPDVFDYDQWDSVALHEAHEPLDQQRICRHCEYEFVQNGGRFDQHRYAGWEECDHCYGMGRVQSDVQARISEKCPTCDGVGAFEVGQ